MFYCVTSRFFFLAAPHIVVRPSELSNSLCQSMRKQTVINIKTISRFMLSLSIKISNLAIYYIIYISKACILVCFVYSCVWVYRNSRTTQYTGVDKYMYSNFGNILRIECQDNHTSYKAIGNYTGKSSWKCWLSMNYLFYWCLMSKYYYKHRCIQDKRATTHNHNSFNFLFIFFLIIYAASSRRKEST